MDIMSKARAAQMVARAVKAEDLKSRLVCLYDAFVCLFGEDALSKAASAAGLDATRLKAMVDSCVDDSDVRSCDRTEVDSSVVNALYVALQKLL